MEGCIQPRFFHSLNPRRAQNGSVECESKTARLSPVISTLPTDLHRLPYHQKSRVEEIATRNTNTSGWHPLAVNLFKIVFELDYQTNSIQFLPENVVLQQTPIIQSSPMDAMLQHTPCPVIQPNTYFLTSMCYIPEINR